ncbi:MAG: queuosine precursor transporter [Planctomycetota bacterium]
MRLHEPLPSRQHTYEGLPALTEATLHARRERVFLIFAGLFLGTLAMLNILGISRFITLFEIDFDRSVPGATVFAVALGVLPYPITFLCTDFISELYGRKRANWVVFVGLILNLWVMFILWLGGVLPGTEATEFFEIRRLAFGAVTASMIAYLVAQFVDVQVFHFWKNLTRGKHLWLRNNGSTVISQLVDTTAVILITHFYAGALGIEDGDPVWTTLLVFIATGYVFKLTAALVDTLPFYFGAYRLAKFLRLPPPHHNEHG